ncbi:hypothetical protein [Companilactobacillus nodensis]|uniref:hypothetical protein n=1 Tax=Companilactobacillus nodensis TaxID=460870 RepID=UPI000468FF74|nr:hypothetical protein [Companilactobacillus nodensis]
MNKVTLALMIASAIIGLVVLGFVITWSIGFFVKKKTVLKVGKWGLIISLPILIILSTGTGVSYHKELQQKQKEETLVKKMDNTVSKTMYKFDDLYIATAVTLESIGNKEYKSWGKAIDDSEGDFDVDTEVDKIVEDNQKDIDTTKEGTEKLKEYITKMDDNDTNSYDIDKYKDAYKKIDKMYDYISNPTGSYNNFYDKFTQMDDEVNDSYKDITN